jgi:nucleotide-binding universal stress UspA family protein
MKILIAADGSNYTKRMLAYVAAHDEWLGDKHDYTVLTAVPLVPPRAAAVVPRDALLGYYEEEAEKVLKPIRAFFEQQHMKAQFIGKSGHVPDVISQFADEGKFDLMLMGSHGHSNVTNLIMGSVATRVLAHCKVPVLLVR